MTPFCEPYQEQGNGNWEPALEVGDCARLQGAAEDLRSRVCDSWAATFTDATGEAAYAVRSATARVAPLYAPEC